MDNKIGFIGGGNMAQAMIGGLVTTGMPTEMILVSDPTASQRELVSHRYDVRTLADNAELAASVDVLVLAVKPQVMAPVARELPAAGGQYRRGN
jgi:pyrroline-5-carboxylate reductase